MPTFPLSTAHLPANGKMATVTLDGTDVLITCVDGEYHALHPKCTHYGAPLVEGALSGHRLVCPWHHACFDARTGQHLEAPGCNALATYPIEHRDGQYHVTLPEHGVGDGETLNPMASGGRRDVGAPYVIIGGGAAGQRCAEGLREAGYEGRIVLLSADDQLPYDRTQLSKGFLAKTKTAKVLPLRPADFYRVHDIDVRLATKATRVDHTTNTIHLEDGNTVTYSKLCVATGSTPRRPSIPGAQLGGIHTLRTLNDARALLDSLEGARTAVVVGASFIGMEVAGVLRAEGLDVTVVAPEEVPFGKTLGVRVGKTIQHWHEEKGVEFAMQQRVVAFHHESPVDAEAANDSNVIAAGVASGGSVASVELEDGRRLPAHVVVLGIGVTPNVGLLSDLASEDGGFDLDIHGYLGHDIWCAGDIARLPQGPLEKSVRIEHWRVAQQQGLVAGYNMAGVERPFRSIPFFWTEHWGRKLRYVGHHDKTDEVRFDGSPEDGPFIAYYYQDGQLAAALGVGRDREMAELQEELFDGTSVIS